MIIDLAQIRLRGKPLRVEREFSAGELDLQSEILRLEEPARVQAEIQVSGDRVRVAGELFAAVELTCCRCLTNFRQSIQEEFRLEYRPDPESVLSHEEGLSYGDLGIGFYHEDRLDLSAIVGEEILLALPMNPLCRSDCKGLCDQCGENLNQVQCGCERKITDPRLAVLEEFRKKLKG